MSDRGGSVSETESLYSSRDGESIAFVEWGDPRVSGTITTRFNVDVDLKTGQGVMWGTIRIENDGGSWEGPFSGVEYDPPDEGDFFTSNGWLTGDGDYAGYTLFLQQDAHQSGGPIRTWHGVIYSGQPPIE